MTEGAGVLPLTTYMGCGPNAPRVWYMLKYLCTCGAVVAVSRYEWWCVLLECICTLSLDPRLLQAHSIPTRGYRVLITYYPPIWGYSPRGKMYLRRSKK